jgi:hypothetical protein
VKYLKNIITNIKGTYNYLVNDLTLQDYKQLDGSNIRTVHYIELIEDASIIFIIIMFIPFYITKYTFLYKMKKFEEKYPEDLI